MRGLADENPPIPLAVKSIHATRQLESSVHSAWAMAGVPAVPELCCRMTSSQARHAV
jgi:hypothetical protein